MISRPKCLRHDLMSTNDIGINNKVFVNHGHRHCSPAHGYAGIKDIGSLLGVVGL